VRDSRGFGSATVITFINRERRGRALYLGSVNLFSCFLGILKEGLRSVVGPGVEDEAGSFNSSGGHLLWAKFVHQVVFVKALELLKAII
jgi:hypothetical protein